MTLTVVKKTILALASSVLFISSAQAHGNHDHDMANSPIGKAVNSELRSDTNKARDKYRNPIETLSYFGLKPEMTVVEIWPGKGWYTEILTPIVKDKGKLYAAHFPADTDNQYFKRNLEKYKAKLASNSAYEKVELSHFYPGSKNKIAPDNSADLIVTFRNIHNWYMQKDLDGVAEAFKAFYLALKPGGTLGIVDHELPKDKDQTKWKKSGYIQKKVAIEAALAAGFEITGITDINHNSKDTADHPDGVWSLPPSLRGDDKEKYLAIGESNRFTIKFQKPNK